MGHGSPSTKYEVRVNKPFIDGDSFNPFFLTSIPFLDLWFNHFLHFQVNEKRDKEKKGVDNDAYDGKKETDVEKGNEKDEKWKNNYVPFDESKEKENE